MLRLDIQRVARIGERDRDPDVADVLLEARRPDGVRHVSDLRRAGPDGPVLRHLGAEFVTLELDAHEPAIDSGASHLLQRGLPDVVLGLVLDEAFEPHDVEGRVAETEVRPVVEDPALDPTRLAGSDGPDVELLTGRGDRVPQVVAASVQQVHLEPGDRRPARAADHDRDALDLELLDPVVPDVVDRRAHELLERLRRQGPLDLHGMDVGQAHLRIQAGHRRDAEGVQAGIGIGQLHPPAVGSDVEQNRVVDDRAVRRRDQHVLALLDLAPGQVATRDHVDQPVRVGTRDLDGALDADVPHRHAVVQHPVLDLGVVEVTGQIHVVVDVVRGAAGPPRRLEEG